MVLGGTVRTYSTSAKIVRIGVIKLSILSLEEDYDKHKQLHSHFTPVFFLYRLYTRSIYEQHISTNRSVHD